MKSILFCLLAILGLWGCTTPQKYQQIVTARLRQNGIPTVTAPFATATLTSNLPKRDTLCTIKRTRYGFVPAIIVWTWQNTFECSISPDVPAGYFSQSLAKYADSLHLKETLNGRRLELQLETLPYNYTHDQSGNTIIIGFYALTKEDNKIVPQNEPLRVHYSVWNGANQEKQGTISVPNNTKGINNNMTSTKKIVWWYLDRYKTNMDRMTRQFVVQLARDLKS